MTKTIEAGDTIVRLSKKHDVDPYVVVALLAIHALCDLDFQKLRFWNTVCDFLAGRAVATA